VITMINSIKVKARLSFREGVRVGGAFMESR
jgi:hypothetical protein